MTKKPKRNACDNCQERFRDEDLVLPIPNLWERLEVGGEVPAGECPECGALCYRLAPKKRLRPLSNEKVIEMYLHCGECIAELRDGVAPDGESPESYARLALGWTKYGIQAWCNRHQANVAHIDFEGATHPANVTRRTN